MSERKVLLISPSEAKSPLMSRKLHRNAKCVCGSGKKQKQCCGSETRYYSLNPKLPKVLNHDIS